MNKKQYQKYVRWAATPSEQRTYSNNEQYMQGNNVSREDIATFQKHETFESDLNNEVLAWASRETPKLLHNLYKKMQTKPNSSDMKQWLDIVKSADKGSGSYNEYDFESKLSDTQVKDIIKYLKDK